MSDIISRRDQFENLTGANFDNEWSVKYPGLYHTQIGAYLRRMPVAFFINTLFSNPNFRLKSENFQNIIDDDGILQVSVKSVSRAGRLFQKYNMSNIERQEFLKRIEAGCFSASDCERFLRLAMIFVHGIYPFVNSLVDISKYINDQIFLEKDDKLIFFMYELGLNWQLWFPLSDTDRRKYFMQAIDLYRICKNTDRLITPEKSPQRIEKNYRSLIDEYIWKLYPSNGYSYAKYFDENPISLYRNKPSEIQLELIRTPEDLRRSGLALDNCVGREYFGFYNELAKKAECIFFRTYYKDVEYVILLRLDTKNGTWRHEMKGLKNAPPPDEIAQILDKAFNERMTYYLTNKIVGKELTAFDELKRKLYLGAKKFYERKTNDNKN